MGRGYRGLGREAIAAILQGQMAQAIDGHLDQMLARRSRPAQWLLSTPSADRARRYRAGGAAHPAVHADYGGAGLCSASRAGRPHDPVVLCAGLSVRKVSQALLPILGRPISPPR
jgi:hypothetical protein